MFDLGWLELIVIGVTALIVVGPKDLPHLFRTAGKFFGKARAMAREFTQSMEQAADESGLKDATRTLNSISELHEKTKSPLKDQVAESFKKRVNPINESIQSTGNFDVSKTSINEKSLHPKKKEKSNNRVSSEKTVKPDK